MMECIWNCRQKSFLPFWVSLLVLPFLPPCLRKQQQNDCTFHVGSSICFHAMGRSSISARRKEKHSYHNALGDWGQVGLRKNLKCYHDWVQESYGCRCRWYVYGFISANTSALLVEVFVRRKRKEKSRDVVTHVVPIRFWILWILHCQGIYSSVGKLGEVKVAGTM